MTLLVDPRKVGGRLSLSLPLSAPVQARIEEAIEDAQAEVEGFLHRPLEAAERTIAGLWADPRFDPATKEAWPQAAALINDRYSVVSYVANPAEPDLWDVTFKVGLDVAGDAELKPILRYIGQAAAASVRADPTFTAVKRAKTSEAAGGQSASYESASGKAGQAGAALTLKALKKWRRYSIHQASTPPQEPWPYAYRH